MLKTIVVSTDLLSSMMVLMPEELSLPVPEFTEMWIPLPPGQPNDAPLACVVAFNADVESCRVAGLGCVET
jgi:hypothetical protein